MRPGAPCRLPTACYELGSSGNDLRAEADPLTAAGQALHRCLPSTSPWTGSPLPSVQWKGRPPFPQYRRVSPLPCLGSHTHAACGFRPPPTGFGSSDPQPHRDRGTAGAGLAHWLVLSTPHPRHPGWGSENTKLAMTTSALRTSGTSPSSICRLRGPAPVLEGRITSAPVHQEPMQASPRGRRA